MYMVLAFYLFWLARKTTCLYASKMKKKKHNRHLANNFRGRVDFVKGLPDTDDAEVDLMNLLQKDRNKQKLVILDDVLEESLSGRASKLVSKLFYFWSTFELLGVSAFTAFYPQSFQPVELRVSDLWSDTGRRGLACGDREANLARGSWAEYSRVLSPGNEQTTRVSHR